MKTSEITGFRKPTRQEIGTVSKYMVAYYKTNSKLFTITGAILIIFGILTVNGAYRLIIDEGDRSGSLPLLIVGAAALAVAILAFHKTIVNKKSTDLFIKGKFLVMDGTVTRIDENVTDPIGTVSVKFTSDTGITIDRYFWVRQEDLEIGTPLLLVYAPKGDIGDERDSQWVFTPYMLTEEGIRKHRL